MIAGVARDPLAPSAHAWHGAERDRGRSLGVTPELASSLAQAPPPASVDVPVWTPSGDDIWRSNLAAFVAGLRARVPALADLDPRAYERVHAWSIAEPAAFWAAVWAYADVVSDVDAAGRAWDAVLVGGERGRVAARSWGALRAEGGAKYRAAYFEQIPGMWRHRDWAARTAHATDQGVQRGLVIHGRSDATLNLGGVCLGTAELYRQAEQVAGVREALAVEQQLGTGVGRTSRLVLFVRLRDGVALTLTLRDAIRTRLRARLTPHHVPRVIVAVPDLPRTRNGKLSELAARDAVHGREVRNMGALANPEVLAHFRDRPELCG